MKSKVLWVAVTAGFLLAPREIIAAPIHQQEQKSCEASQPAPGAEEYRATQADMRLVQDVVKQMGAAKPENLAWPPEIFITDTPIVQACAVPDRSHPRSNYVVVYTGLLRDVVQGKPDRLALILGHEFSHISLGHLVAADPVPGSPFVYVTLSRGQEAAADKNGLQWALRAGYSYSQAIKAFERMREVAEKPGRNGTAREAYFEALKSDHPTLEERIAALDKIQPELWQSLDDFKTGVYFLETEQYSFARDCFRSVTKRFPESSEAWSNLGYAELMLYADALDERDLRNFGPREIITGSFYRRATSLESQVRGIDEDLWWKAVGDLKHSISLNPKLAASHASLGIAYLLRPAGPDPGTSQKYLEQAFQLASDDVSLDPISKVTLLVNLGVAAASSGDVVRAEKSFGDAWALLNQMPGKSLAAPRVAQAILYNQSLRLATSTAQRDQERALKQLEDYLRQTSPESSWWNLAYDEYARLAVKLATKPSGKDALKQTIARQYRATAGLKVAKGEIRLGEPLQQAQTVLGRGTIVPAIPNTNLVIVRYPSEGIELIANDQVLAIVLTTNQYSINLFEKGLGAKAFALKVGMKTGEVQEVLGAPTAAPLLNKEQRCMFYLNQGVAYQADSENAQVVKVIVVQVPEKKAVL